MDKKTLGLSEDEVHRPEIMLENLDVSGFTKQDFLDDTFFYDGICIPLVQLSNPEWKSVWFWMVNKFEMKSGYIVKENQPVDLCLYIEDDPTTEERSYTLSAFLKIDDYGEVITECETEKIIPVKGEIEAINLALLKVSNYEEYFLKYTRYQVAANKLISGFGFVMDEIDSSDMYKSIWLSCDQKVCIIGCISNVHNATSKLQVLKVG
ncbi:protein of unknown function [Ruminococcaceae bacterium BL-6]|nr:protein of unknown function [Ruminococcaceae bacterium BL-6]